jgi:hypothetical protein
MCMRDFLLPRNTAGCVYRCQTENWCNMCTSHSRFTEDECLEQRYCVKFCLKLRDTEAETIHTIQQAFGNDAMG